MIEESKIFSKLCNFNDQENLKEVISGLGMNLKKRVLRYIILNPEQHGNSCQILKLIIDDKTIPFFSSDNDNLYSLIKRNYKHFKNKEILILSPKEFLNDYNN